MDEATKALAQIAKRQIDEAKDRIEMAAQVASETAPDWETRCDRILSALGLDFGQNDERPVMDEKVLKTADEIRHEERMKFLPVLASLAAAISLLEKGGKAAKKAAPSDKMFDQMLADYRKSLDESRELLKQGLSQ